MESLKPVKLNLAKKFRESRKYAHEFFRERAKDEIAIQIRELREKRKLRQIDFAKQANMKQSAVSRIEQADYSGWTFRTLMKVAEALDARLRIVFQPMEDVIAEYERKERPIIYVGETEVIKESIYDTAASRQPYAVKAQASPFEPPGLYDFWVRDDTWMAIAKPGQKLGAGSGSPFSAGTLGKRRNL